MASNSPVLPGDLSYASIDTVLNAADDAYDVYSGAQMLTSSGATSTSYQELIDSGWTQIESPRLSRRLHHLREWSHGKYVKEIFS